MKKDALVVGAVKNMNVRKLQKEEHIRTRKLWELIFTEDTPEFLDYYYSVKIKENEIYVIEQDGEIVSMLHLNPYQMRIKDRLYQTHYIVAVATHQNYRKQGFMRQLLEHVIQVMKERGEPFTFLMPASEAIYKPFGFEYIYEQKRQKLTGKKYEEVTAEFVEARQEHCQLISDFANRFLMDYDVVTWRDAKYYKTMLSECSSENGGILILKRGADIEGIFPYTREGKLQLHEPLCFQKEDIEYAIYHLTGDETEDALCVGYGTEEKPMIMAKMLNESIAKELKNLKVFLNEVV